MGFKERVESVKGKPLMTSFFAAEMLDTAITKIGMQYFNGSEINPFGGAEAVNNIGLDQAIVLKTATIVILIASYALASENSFDLGNKFKDLNIKRALEKGLQWGNLIAWGVVAWNAANLAPEVISKIT